MSNPLLSVIVPVYNVEKYLNKCVESIVNQSYENLEIILVDDGSTDSCGDMCDELSKRDSRIKVIHKENGGLSSARNTGLDEAKGELIAFVDSDDWINVDMYQLLIKNLQANDADICYCDINYVVEDNDKEVPLTHEKTEIYEGQERLHLLVSKDCQTVSQWNKVYKSYIFDDLRYPEGRLHEDVYVVHEELYRAKKVVYLDLPLYNYLQRGGSIMNTDEKLTQVIDAVMGYRDRVGFFDEKNEKEAKKDAVSMLYEYCRWKYDSYCNGKNKANAEVLLKALRDAIKDFNEVLEPDEGLKRVAFENNKYLRDRRVLKIKASVKNIIKK